MEVQDEQNCFLLIATIPLCSVFLLVEGSNPSHTFGRGGKKPSAMILCDRDWERLHRKLPGPGENRAAAG